MIPKQLVQDVMEEHGIPGAAVGVLHGDELEVAGFGVTSVENPLPVDPDTLFQIGSITKTFVATAAMRLVEAGKLDLDEPVITYIPTLRFADESVTSGLTMRHLLTHTGGWFGNYFTKYDRNDDALERIVATMHTVEQQTPLGEVSTYNNSGFYVAGRVIEVLHGKVFEDALRELVLDPLGLEHTTFYLDEVISRRFAAGHLGQEVARPWALGRQVAPAGGLISDLNDVLAYGRAQWESNILSPESFAEMRRPQADFGGGPGESVGLCWFRFERGPYWFIHHSGGTNGQTTQIVVCPDERLAVVVLTNSFSGMPLLEGVTNAVLKAELGVEPPAPPEVAERTPDELREYEGTYESRVADFTLEAADGGLVVTSRGKGGFPEPDSPPRPDPPPTRVGFIDADRMITVEGEGAGQRGDFLRGPDGSIAWLRFGLLAKKVAS
jgi:CubicO group peptidase (beta-lactamase class C family)